MRLAPQVQAFFDAAPTEPLDFLTVAEQRQLIRHLSDLSYLRFGRRAEPVADVTDHAVPVQGGEMTLRAYRPSHDSPLPAHLELHGGGWWLGSIDERINDALCRYRCLRTGCVVFTAEYRLAPEHPFPTAPTDAYAALEWIAEHASELGIDLGSVSVGGTSAGANLAAAVTLLARDRSGPPLVLQLLEVPALDLTGETMRAALRAEDLRPMAHRQEEFETPLRHYLRDMAQARHPLASPVHAADLSGLPPAQIMTAEYDPLREEGEWYARRLTEAGVPVTLTRYTGAIHGTGYLTRVWKTARDWQREAVRALRQAHGQEPLAEEPFAEEPFTQEPFAQESRAQESRAREQPGHEHPAAEPGNGSEPGGFPEPGKAREPGNAREPSKAPGPGSSHPPAAPTPAARFPGAQAEDAPAADAPATSAPATSAPATSAPAPDAPARRGSR